MAEGKRNCSDSPEHEQSKKIKTIGPLEAPPDGETTDLPEEIIVQILKILPVKSLLRFRCVCKSWLTLISSSEFIKTHLNYSINDANSINHRIMFTILNPKDNLKHCSAHSVMFEPLTVASDIDYPRTNRHMFVRVMGSCNGLICFAISRQGIYLWNPSTRTLKKLPSPAVKMMGPAFCVYGFGYDESDDDYKVVGFFCNLGYPGMSKSLVKIYSPRTNSWKRIGDFAGGVVLDHCCKFANGKLHFITEQEIDSNYELALLSLDLNSEVYGKVELPNYEEGYSITLLGVLGGCICLTLNYRQIHADVWVLKEYDVKESWTKLVSIPYVDPLEIGCQSPYGICFYPKPVLMLPSGEILLVFAECLVIYNPKDNCFRRPGTSNTDYFLEADMYVESLVSL